MMMLRRLAGLSLGALLALAELSAVAQEPAKAPQLRMPPQKLKLRDANELKEKVRQLRSKLKAPPESQSPRSNQLKPGKARARTLPRAQARQHLRQKDPKAYAEHRRSKIKALLKATVGSETMTPAIQTLLRASAQRQASLNRIEDLALAASDDVSLRRIEKLRAAETARLTDALKRTREKSK